MIIMCFLIQLLLQVLGTDISGGRVASRLASLCCLVKADQDATRPEGKVDVEKDPVWKKQRHRVNVNKM